MHDDIQKTLREVNNILGNMWYESHMYKEKSFEYENEFRVVLCKLGVNEINNELDKIHTIITENNIKPVLKIKIVENWDNIITNIIISPFNQSDKICENIDDFLHRNHVTIDKNMIKKSNCPIRNF